MKKIFIIVLIVLVALCCTYFNYIKKNKKSNKEKDFEKNTENYVELKNSVKDRFSIKTIESNSEYMTYTFDYSKTNNSDTNFVIIDVDKDNLDEYNVNAGDEIQNLKILEKTDEYIRINVMESKSPQFKTGGINLSDIFDDVKIYKNTGIVLSMQAMDYIGGDVYVFYIEK